MEARPFVSLDDLQDALNEIGLYGVVIVEAGWTMGLRDFEIDLDDGRTIRFEDCLQASWQRVSPQAERQNIEGWWLDEPSPLLQTLPPEVRFAYHHLVIETGGGLLRIAFRQLGIDAQAEQE